jgi:hypothetical protein
MPLDFRVGPINFDTSPGAQQEYTTVVFDSNVLRADAALRSVSLGFTNFEEPAGTALSRITVDVEQTLIHLNTVRVVVRVDLAGRPKTFPAVDGHVRVLVLAEVE